MFPGATVPARILIYRIIDNITSVAGICNYTNTSSPAWKGCPHAKYDFYAKGREKTVDKIISKRNKQEMENDKKKSLEAMYKAKSIKVRPHIMLCSVCQYGLNIRPPYKEDNLPELVELISNNPDVLITMVEGADEMMCAPCPYRVPESSYCIWSGPVLADRYSELNCYNYLLAYLFLKVNW